jgi:hypothetical protein
MQLPFVSTIIASVAFLLSAQDAGRGGQPKGGAATVMILTIPGFPDGGQIPVKFSQAAPGVAVGEGTSPAMSWGQRARRHAILNDLLPLGDSQKDFKTFQIISKSIMPCTRAWLGRVV